MLKSLLILLICGSLQALPIGNPCDASLYDTCLCTRYSCLEAFSLRLGFYGDYVFNRHLEVENGNTIHTTKLSTNAGYLALNICQTIDLFATLGETHINIESDAQSFELGMTPSELELNFHSDFSWSAGIRATLWQWRCGFLGIEGQYFCTETAVDYLLLHSMGSLFYLDDVTANYSECQVGLGAGYSFDLGCPQIVLAPYVGVKWSWAKFDVEGLAHLEEKKVWGYAIGTSVAFYHLTGMNVEIRLADEKALNVQWQACF